MLTKFKRLLAGLLSFTMMISMLPGLAVSAQETNVTTLVSEAYTEDKQSEIPGIEQSFSPGDGYSQLPNHSSELELPYNHPKITMEDMMQLPSKQMSTSKALSTTSTDIQRYTVLVLDTSSSSSFVGADGNVFYTADTAVNEVKASAKKFIKDVQSADGTNFIAIVSYKGSTATIVAPFSTDSKELEASINGLYASSNTRSVEAGLKAADNLINQISIPNAMKNVVLFTTGMTNDGSYNYNGHYNESTIASNWMRSDTRVRLYAYANTAYTAADSLKSKSTLYTIGLFNTMENMPEEGRDVVQFFKLCALEWATSSKYFYDVKDPNELEFVFGEIAKDITDYKIEFNYGSGSSRDYTETCYFSHEYFKNKSTSGYNASLSTSSLCFALSCFASNEQGYDNKFVNAKDFLTKLEFKEFDTNDWYTKKPQSDSIGVVAANKKIKVNQEEYTLIACGIRGGGYESEWAGNFTLGRTGNHYGFERARNQVIEFLRSYISENKITGKVKLWITGYSRGAATSNMVAGAINDGTSLGNSITLEKGDLYAYTFETPQGALNSNLSNKATYNNIYNIINRNDPVPRVAMTGFGFTRYGNDKFLPSLSTDGIYYKDKQLVMLNFYSKINSYSEVGEYSVDDFKMLEFNLKYLLPGGKDFIQVDENTTQDTFLDDFISKVVKDSIKTRDYYVDELQNGIRSIFTAIHGTLLPDEPVSRVMDAMNIYIDKLIEWSTIRDIALIILNPLSKDSIEDYITNLLEESFNEAGINYYNKNSLKNFAVEICNIVVPFSAKYPNYVYTTKYNLDKLIEAHYPELCFAWLKSQDINYTNTPVKFTGIGQYRIIRINCPVDLKVFNSNNTLISHFEANTVKDIPGSYISSYVNLDGEKVIYLPTNEDFRIDIIPTDNGIMNYSVNEYSSSKDDYTRILNYYDIPIIKGQTLSALVPAFSEEEYNNYTNGSNTRYSVKDSSGNAIEPSTDLKGDEAANAYYFVSVKPEKEEQGIVTGQGVRNEGAFAQVEAIANEGYTFIGWYNNGTTLVSKEIEYRFCVRNDISLVAKFEFTGTKLEIVASAGGSIIDGKSGNYKKGDIIHISAIADPGYRFKNWSSSNGGTFADMNSKTTTFTMPDNSTTVTANFEFVGIKDDDIKVTFNVTSKWDTAFNADITITNISNKVIDNWILQFDMPYEITNIWNGIISSNSQRTYVIKNAGHNQDINPGSSVSFGFSANTTDENIVSPISFAIIGKKAQTVSDRYEINFEVTSDWKSAFNGNIVIKNISNETIEDWLLEFDFDHKITAFWTADIISHEGNHYVVKNRGYNANIAPGQSITLGFGGNPGNVVKAPKDYVLYYVGMN